MLGRTVLVAAGFLALSPVAAAEDFDPHVWLNPGVLSHHFKDDRDYREKNYGVGVELFFTPRHGVVAGSFMNSNDERSRYIGYHWRPLQLAFERLSFRGGLVFSLIDGYSDVRDGKTFALVVPALSVEYRALGVNLVFVPHHEHSSALALQLRLRVW
jgi:hypothetical protein